MKITSTYHSTHEVLLKVRGDIDSYTFPLFAREMSLLKRLCTPSVLVDLTECQFISIETIKFIAKTDLNKTATSYRYKIKDMDTRELLTLMTDYLIILED